MCDGALVVVDGVQKQVNACSVDRVLADLCVAEGFGTREEHRY